MATEPGTRRLSSDDPSATESSLAAILEHVGEAVMVRRPDGKLVFANRAAVELLGLSDPAEVESLTSQQLMDRFEVYDEDGRPLALEDLPGTRILREQALELPEMVVRNVDRRTGVERWLRNKATAVVGRDGAVTMAVNLIDDVTEDRRAEFAQRLLGEAGEVLSSSLDYERTLQAVAELAVPRLADWCGVDLPDASGRVVPVAIVHRDSGQVSRARRLRDAYPTSRSAPAGVGAVIRTGRSQLVSEVTDDMVQAAARDARHLELMRALGVRSAMIVPMRTASGAVLGAITFASSSARRYGEDDLRLAEELGRRAGVAVENARLYRERTRIAHTLQSALLPPRMPEIAGWELATSYRPAGEVGGDFYDAVRLPDGGWALFIGDVAGKGARAASLTALARHTLHTALELTMDPGRALAYLNERLGRKPELSLATVAVVMLPEAGDSVEIVAAGHPLPLLASAGSVATVGAPHRLLGAFDRCPSGWAATRHPVAEGDLLLLFTDGAVDARGAGGERFGDERLRSVLSSVPPSASAAEAIAAVERALETFVTGPHADDVALLALRRR